MHSAIYYIIFQIYACLLVIGDISYSGTMLDKKQKHVKHILLQQTYLLSGNLLLEKHEFCYHNCWGYSNLSHLIETYTE